MNRRRRRVMPAPQSDELLQSSATAASSVKSASVVGRLSRSMPMISPASESSTLAGQLFDAITKRGLIVGHCWRSLPRLRTERHSANYE